MTNKSRLSKLEKRREQPKKIVIMFDAADECGLAKFDGVKMTQAEAEAKAAALPDNVPLLRVSYASLTPRR